MARLFTGIFPPDDVTAEIAPLRDQGRDMDVRWIPPGKLHATLVFIGHVPDDAVDVIPEALSTVRFQPFEVRMTGVGAFPNARRARVLWVGLEPAEPVVRLYDGVVSALDTALDMAASRPYHPHVTVARTRGKSRTDARPWVDIHAGFSGQPFPVRSFALVRSRTKPEGAEYTVIGRFGPGPTDGSM